MSSSIWSRLEEVFGGAVERSGADREQFLATACAGDAALRREVDQMIAAHEREGALAIERRFVPAAGADPLVGRQLGAYRIVDRIGEGGMGSVYVAERADGAFEQRVAVKVVRAPGTRRAEMLERFGQERRILAALAHPGIARLVDAGLSPEGQPYLVMEFVDGEPLTAHCDRHRLPVRERLALFRRVCEAVDHAHRNLVVHRDLKPSNIFVTPAGEVKLLDFGIAKLLGATGADGMAPMTRTGFRPMTPEYAAPEQVTGAAITTATDVYALGVLLYELLTGLRPPGAARTAEPTPPGVVPPSTAAGLPSSPPGQAPAPDPVARAEARSTTPARLRRLLAGDLDTVVAMALRPEPERRYASAAQLSEDLERALAGLPVRAQRDSASYRVRRFVARHWVGVGVAASAVLTLAGVLAFSVQQWGAVARETDVVGARPDKADSVADLLVGLFESTSPRVLPRGDLLTLGEFIPQAERRALQRLAGQPELAARMRFVLGRVARARNRYADAREHLEQALVERRRLAGPDDAEALDIAVALGDTLLELGRRDEARPLLQDAYDRLRAGPGLRVAEAALVLANAHGLSGEGERLLRESLALRRAATPPDAASVARGLIHLGNFLVLSNRVDEGIPLLEEALALMDAPSRRADPQLLTALNDLAQARIRRQELADAERLERRLLETAPSIVEPESLPVANALNNLGNILAMQGRHGEAEATLRRSFAMHERLFGAPHGRTANVARNLGVVLGLQRQYAEAREWIDRAVVLTAGAGGGAEATAWMRAQRATMAARLGPAAAAVPDVEQAMADLGTAATPQAAAQLAECRLLYGGLLVSAGRAAEALAPLEAARDYFATIRTTPKPKLAWVDVEIGRALSALGRCDQAAPRLAALDVYAGWGLAVPDRVADARQAQVRCQAERAP